MRSPASFVICSLSVVILALGLLPARAGAQSGGNRLITPAGGTVTAALAQMEPATGGTRALPDLRRELVGERLRLLRRLPGNLLSAADATGTDARFLGNYVVNDDRIGGADHVRPRLGFAASGDCVMAWSDTRNGDPDPYVQRLDPNGNRVGDALRACDDADMWWQGEPGIGVQRDGRFLVAWEDRRGGKSNVTAQRFLADGTPVDTNFRINENTPGDKRVVSFTVLPDDRLVAVWEDWRQDNGHIFGQMLDSDCRPIGTNFSVNTVWPGWQAYGASIDSDTAGNFTITWMNAGGGWDIYAQRYDLRGARIGENFKVNNDTNWQTFQWAPSVGMATDGSFAITWEDSRDDTLHSKVYCQRYNARGQTLGANFMVNDSLPGVSSYSPFVCFDSAGGFLVSWVDSRDGGSDIYAQRYDRAGARLGGNFRLNDNAGIVAHGNPAARFGPQGEYWGAFDDSRAGAPSICVQRLNASGSKIGANFIVNDDSFGSDQRVSSVAACEGNRIVTVWEDERNGGGSDIYYQLCDSLGGPIGPNIRANDDGPGFWHFYSTAAACPSGRSVTAWTDERGGLNIYGQAFDADGHRVGANFRVNDNSGDVHHWAPAAGMDSAGNSVVVFSDARQGSERIFAQRYDADFNPKGANVLVGGAGTGGQYYVSVAMSKYGRFISAWMDGRNSSLDVYAQIFDSAGEPVDTNFRVNDDAGGTYQGYPGIACDAQGNFLVVWEDGRRADHTDIYGQRFDYKGYRIGGNFIVNAGLPENDAYSPSCAIDRQGQSVVVWTDYRGSSTNPEIYCQRYRPDGTPVLGNVLVHDSDLFYYNHHWTMNKNVAAIGDRLAFSWTENRRHRGWDTYNYITDWDLVGVGEDVGRRTSDPAGGSLSLNLSSSLNPGRLELTLPVPQYVRLALFDACGRQVRRLFEGVPATTGLGLTIDSRTLTRGTYFLVARTTRQGICRKVVVVTEP